MKRPMVISQGEKVQSAIPELMANQRAFDPGH